MVKKIHSIVFMVIICSVPLILFNILFPLTSSAEVMWDNAEILRFVVNDNEAHVDKCNLNIKGEIVIPETFSGKPVTEISGFAFSDCTNLTNIVIPDSITIIGSHAFVGCSGLTEIIIPGRVTSIGTEAFANCSSLISVMISRSVTDIGNNAFISCNPSLTIKGLKGTIAETYAEKNKINFKAFSLLSAITGNYSKKIEDEYIGGYGGFIKFKYGNVDDYFYSSYEQGNISIPQRVIYDIIAILLCGGLGYCALYIKNKIKEMRRSRKPETFIIPFSFFTIQIIIAVFLSRNTTLMQTTSCFLGFRAGELRSFGALVPSLLSYLSTVFLRQYHCCCMGKLMPLFHSMM